MRCSFCKGTIAKGRAFIWVSRTGDVYRFCSSKCRRNWQMQRKPARLKWTHQKKKEVK